MNLSYIDFVIKGYEKSLNEGDRARLAFFRELWGVVNKCEEALGTLPFNLDAQQVKDSFEAHAPVLHAHPAQIDPKALADAQRALLACALGKGGFAPEVEKALSQIDWSDVVESSDCALAGADPSRYLEIFAGILTGRGLDGVSAYIAASCMSLAIRAQIEGVAAFISELAGPELLASVHTMHCPVCGSNPGLARVGGSSSSDGRGKTLGCLQCGTSWEFERIRCVHCGVQNSKRLHYYNIEGDDSHRINTCDECGGYLRTTFVEDSLVPFSFEVEDVVMAKLDALAADPSIAKGSEVGKGEGSAV